MVAQQVGRLLEDRNVSDEKPKTWEEWAACGDISYWDCSQPDQLTHSDFVEAVCAHIEGWLDTTCDVEALVREQFAGGLDVEGYERNEAPVDWGHKAADNIVDRLAEELDEEFGDVNWGDHQVMPEKVRAELLVQLTAVLDAIRPKLDVWQCEQTVTVKLSLEELLDLLREAEPSWFEK